jgi:hypothetical protein
MLQDIPYFPDVPSYYLPTSLEECIPDVYSCGELTSTYTTAVSKRLVLKYRLKSIIVRISKAEITCDYEEPQCKYFITSVYIYEAGAIENYNFHFTSTYTDSIGVDSCCVNLFDDTEEGEAFNCNTAADAIVSVSTYAFNRVKQYDSIPSGDITFNNSDYLSETCEATPCGSSIPYITEVCFASEESTPPDLCTETPEYITTSAQLQYCVGWLMGIPVTTGVCEGLHEYVFNSGLAVDDPAGLGPKELTFTHVSQACEDSLPCNSLQYTTDGIYYDGCDPGGGDGCCTPDGLGIPEGGCDCFWAFEDMCCYLGQNNGWSNCREAKAYVIGYNVIDFTWSNTRTTYTEQELCISAPTWTINLS